ncbi:bola-like protein [Basidiobolus meristosporus CBS 931.73]|uniref:Bola-like protein n=1 Tax=Basidiobolus meristosporus CBS 931.73 TaxID=1314790 RepID=A0A1Y1Y0D5_9FUNG|nr:bola-like protein [Basidiobolus meristosporus CBS 931.73]|eukprot:ORX91084.1 bola-like protein [Basidiobolus meristosporus CBS 931.73]
MFAQLRQIARTSVPRASAQKLFYSTESMNAGEKLLFNKLKEQFTPSSLHVHDISGGCGSMYAIEIVSKNFEGLSLVKQHRLVTEFLAEDIKQMHGIQLKTSAK